MQQKVQKSVTAGAYKHVAVSRHMTQQDICQ